MACSENKKQNEVENAAAANIDTADNEVNSSWKFGQAAMGGVCRWDNSEEHRVSLSYGISEVDNGLPGIDGFAVDPNAPNKIYLLAVTVQIACFSPPYGSPLLSSEVYTFAQ